VSNIATADFVGGADGDTTARLRAKGALFLYDYYYAVTLDVVLVSIRSSGCTKCGEIVRTNFGMSLHLEDLYAFCHGCAGVVNDIDHGLPYLISILLLLSAFPSHGSHLFEDAHLQLYHPASSPGLATTPFLAKTLFPALLSMR
jgi:hypothetical protein